MNDINSSIYFVILNLECCHVYLVLSPKDRHHINCHNFEETVTEKSLSISNFRHKVFSSHQYAMIKNYFTVFKRSKAIDGLLGFKQHSCVGVLVDT